MPSPAGILQRVLVTGASGQVGGALIRQLGPSHCIATDESALDLSKLATIRSRLEYFKPTAVINAAAYTAVDQAETETDLAMKINGEAPGVLASWCAEKNVPFVHFSTDYVFPGAGEKPYFEDDATGPLNAYGAGKLEGEKRVAAAGGRFLVFRTSWVYDESGKNFFRTMLRLAAERTELKVVSDQIGAPTYAPMLAAGALEALERAVGELRFPSGIYHLVNRGTTSWHGFAEAIFAGARERGIPLKIESVAPIATSEYKTPARRPLNSRLSCERAERVFGVALPTWQAGLAECLDRYLEKSS